MKPVVFLIINSLYGGGAEHVAARLSSEWTKKYDLKILSLNDFTEKDYDFSGERICLKKYAKSRFWYLRIKQYAKGVDELAVKFHPIAIVSFLQNSNLVNLLSVYNTKRIVSVRNYLPSLHKGIKLHLWKYLIKRYYPRADFVVSVSQLMNSEMQTTYGIDANKCVCIYNPYKIEDIIKLSNEELPKSAKSFFDCHYVMASMGHVKFPKGHYHLVRILPELVKVIPNIGLVIIGDDNTDYARKLKELVRDLRMDNYILFTGRQKNPYNYLKNSKCYVFPSLFEGFPNALVEAMICGLPVIASDCKSGPREILSPKCENQFGFLLPADDTPWMSKDEALTDTEWQYIESIKRMYQNPDDANLYSRLAINRAFDFTMESIVCEWYKLID